MPRPILTAEWQKLLLINYAVDPALLQPALPRGVELDFFGDACYISLVGFLFDRTRLLGVALPFHRTFPEINLRFYVRRRVGTEWRRGVVFLQEMVPKPAIALAARWMYGEPYVIRRMRHSWRSKQDGLHLEYRWKHRGHWNKLAARVEPSPVDMAVGSEAEFITEHYYGYNGRGAVTREYMVKHSRWQIHRVLDYAVDRNFEAQYGPAYAFLTKLAPRSVTVAAGAPVEIWPYGRLGTGGSDDPD